MKQLENLSDVASRQLGGLEATATIDILVIGTVGAMGDWVVLGAPTSA